MKQVFNVPEIHCSSCVMLLESMEEDVPGISSVDVNAGKRVATIDFDEDQLSSEDVIEAIEKASGYKASLHA